MENRFFLQYFEYLLSYLLLVITITNSDISLSSSEFWQHFFNPRLFAQQDVQTHASSWHGQIIVTATEL